MKKTLMLLAAAGFVMLAFSGCVSTGTIQTPAQLLSTLQVKAKKVCTVSVPFLASMSAMKSQLSTDAQGYLSVASDKVNTACSAIAGASGSSVSTASITDLVNKGVPALIQVIDASNMEKDAKSAAEIALTAAQIAVTTALAEYLNAPAAVVPVPASGAVAS